jgi:hypothetical protein
MPHIIIGMSCIMNVAHHAMERHAETTSALHNVARWNTIVRAPPPRAFRNARASDQDA